MKDQLYIPQKLKVGYQKRSDTYTANLGYIIYYDDKGVLRKEKSWEGWRDKKIEPNEFNNVPIEGFVINKDVGGVKRSYSWNARMEKVRIYDPRDFEIEITVENLLFILQESNSIKGKGLEGKFVYGWQGTQLGLLPVESEEYKNSVEFTELQATTLTKKSLVPGLTYRTKQQDDLIYLGHFDWFEWNKYKKENIRIEKNRYSYYGDIEHCDYYQGIEKSKQFVFIDVKTQKLISLKALKNLSKQITDVPVDNFAELLDQFYKSPYGSKPAEIFSRKREIEFKDLWNRGYEDVHGLYCRKLEENKYLTYTIHADTSSYAWNSELQRHIFDVKGYYLKPNEVYTIRNNSEISWDSAKESEIQKYHYLKPDKPEVKRELYTKEEIRQMHFENLFIKLESGVELSYDEFISRGKY